MMGKDLKGKELGKGIRQLKNGSYEARYYDRFGNRKSLYGTSKTEIRNKLINAVKEDEAKTNVRKRYRLCDWYEEWMRVYKEPNVRPNTKRHYEQVYMLHINPELGCMYLDEIRQIDVKNLINGLEKRGLGYETQNKVRIILTDMFTVAIDNEYAVKNPTKGIKLKAEKPDERVVLTVEQEEDFFECAAGTFYNNLYVVADNTGLRPGEVCALQETDLDFKNRTISVTKTLLYQKLDGDTKKEFHLEPPKTDSSVRTVPMNKTCEEALMKQIRLKRLLTFKYPKEDLFSGLLFVTKFNTPICSQVLNDSIKRIINEINLQRDAADLFPVFSAHSFRHTFATRCIENGMPPKVLQRILGHATLQMTMDLYVHVTDEFAMEELDKIERISFSAKNKSNVVAISGGVKIG